jgi:hypothetical protein
MKEEVAGVILGGKVAKAESFEVRWGILKLNLKIRLQTVAQVIEIAGEVGQIRDIDENDQRSMYPVFVERITDVKKVVNAIVIATGTRFRWLVRKMLLGLPLKDIDTLWAIVQRQSDIQRFFFIIISAKGQMNLLKPRTEE